MNEHDHASDIEQTPPLRPIAAPMPAPEAANRYTFAPLPAGCGWNGVLSALLRQPGQIVYQLHESAGGVACRGGAGGNRTALSLGVRCRGRRLFRGHQLWAAPLRSPPVRCWRGRSACRVFTFSPVWRARTTSSRWAPSLGYCWPRSRSMRHCLVSFAPIAWVFSQSTDSIAFISCLHLLLWGVGFYFGLRLVLIGRGFSA